MAGRVVRRLSPAMQAACTHVPSEDAARARVVVVPVLTPGVGAMTLGRVVLVRRGCEGDTALIAHELVHVRQWRELGAWRFLRRYLGDYVGLRRSGLDHRGAYLAIPFEAEARELAGR